LPESTWADRQERFLIGGLCAGAAVIPIHVMPNGDTAGARGAAIEALKVARQSGLR
jgi:hypothetical protein